MVEDILTRVRKRDFAKVLPRLLSENFNEHMDLPTVKKKTKTLKDVQIGLYTQILGILHGKTFQQLKLERDYS